MTPAGQPDDLTRAKPAKAEPRGQGGIDDFIRRLTDEYKMLQDKIDKIGAFRFTIKGWSVTAVIAASAASSSARSVLTVFTVSFGLAIMLIFFFWFEREQVKLRRLFQERAGRLEEAFIRMDRRRGEFAKLPFPVPYTVNEIASANRGQRLQRSGGVKRIEAPRPLSRRLAAEWLLWRRTDVVFYAALLCLAFAPLLPRYRDVSRHWNAWTKQISAVPVSQIQQQIPNKAKKP